MNSVHSKTRHVKDKQLQLTKQLPLRCVAVAVLALSSGVSSNLLEIETKAPLLIRSSAINS